MPSLIRTDVSQTDGSFHPTRRQFIARAAVATTLSSCGRRPARAEAASTAASTFNGSPGQIGNNYGKKFSAQIQENLNILLGPKLPRQDPDFAAWVKSQESLIAKHWPWYIDEIRGVADAVGRGYEDILLLNLRAWQYGYYGAKTEDRGCSSLAVTLADGSIACGGSLDDPIRLYCGPVRIVPDEGHSFVSFPITGTSWGNRGMNSAGLAVSLSSQLLIGLKRLAGCVAQDVAIRAILQTCATVDDVRKFCGRHPFTMNMVCADAQGEVLCAQQTAAGFLEMPVSGACALTNHVADDEFVLWLRRRGVSEFRESPTSRPRRGNLLRLIRQRGGKCSAEEVMKFIANRDDANPGSIHNRSTIYLTFSRPQTSKNTLWIMQPKAERDNRRFEAFAV